MRDGITLERRLSLAGRKSRISPVLTTEPQETDISVNMMIGYQHRSSRYGHQVTQSIVPHQ